MGTRIGALAVALAAAFGGTPAAAAPPAGVVYEITRTSASAPTFGSVRVDAAHGAAWLLAVVSPMDRGYYVERVTYGEGASGDTFHLNPGFRVVVGGVRGRVGVSTPVRGWRVREVGSGFRWVLGPRRIGPAGTPEAFSGSVRAGGGARGSVAVGRLPCRPGVGEGTLRPVPDPHAKPVGLCPGGSGSWYGGGAAVAYEARTWVVEGWAAGVEHSPYRLVVLDMP